MSDTANSNPFHLLTTSQIEEKFGKKYFYRQRVYRLARKGKIPHFMLRGKKCFLERHVIETFLKDLELQIEKQFSEIDTTSLRVYYDAVNGKRIVVDGLLGNVVFVDTDKETEEGLLDKIRDVLAQISNQEVLNSVEEENDNDHDGFKDSSLAHVLPEEIVWIKVDTGNIEGVEVKSFILISLPSIAQFVGVRPDNFTRWAAKTDFKDYVLSAHHKQLQGTQNRVPWKKGIVDGYIPLIPFELVPEVIVAFRQSGNTPKYQDKADLLYTLAKNTLEAVGLAVSGNKDRAAKELARVGKGLGLTVAEQIIGIFKQYETREFQIETTKQFQGKIKQIGGNYAVTVGSLTLGVTGRYPWEWKALGSSRNLPKTITNSSREVMRKLSPADGVGMTFGEKHFTKEPNMPEAIQTGKQGKEFYQRLSNVGLLDD